MRRERAAVATIGAVAIGLGLVSGGSDTGPRTPSALPGLPPPFLGTAVAGSGGLTAAVDAYGDVVDLRAPGPADGALIDNPADRQAAGTVAADTGIVPRVRIGDRPALPLWRGDSVEQRYLPGTNVVRTEARFGDVRVNVIVSAGAAVLSVSIRADGEGVPDVGVSLGAEARCARARHAAQLDLLCRVGRAVPRVSGGAGGSALDQSAGLIRSAAAGDRRWLARARPLGPGAPAWAKRMYARSLLVLRALTDRRTGAVAAGARDGWAYVWPRDAATAALAFATAGYRGEAEKVTRFLLGVDLEEAARFHGDGSPVDGRAAQGDALGWVAAAARGAGLIGSAKHAARILSPAYPNPWRERADYREGEAGDFLANAIASGEPAGGIEQRFGSSRGLSREEGDGDALDSAAAWAVRPFRRPSLRPAARRSLRTLAAEGTPYGIVPGEDWPGGEDPWTAPTAWSAWSLAALAAEAPHGSAATRADRRAALRLLADLRRAATPAGDLPERVDVRTGVPRSTTPLAWSHAFTILALRELWPAAR